MKRLLLTLILIGIIYVLGQMVVSGIKTYTQGASLVLSGMTKDAIHDVVRAHYNEHILTNGTTVPDDAVFVLTPIHLNTDRDLDIIARVESPATCGGGGCITTLFVRTEDGLLESVSFAYAVKELEVLESVTNEMHDIRLNGSMESTMVWDGKQYSTNTF
jgi:Na+-translocating ferredoxin:NAD+ oxidoreductase RnfG subunit